MNGAEDRVSRQAITTRRVLSLSAWTLLVLVLVGFAAYVPSIDALLVRFEATLIGKLVIYPVVVFAGLTGITEWISSIWYASIDPTHHRVPRGLLILVLVIGNLAASFFYYFLVVHWQPKYNLEGGGYS